MLASTITGSISISTFTSLIGIPIGIASAATGLEIWGTTAGLKSISQYLRQRKRSVINIVF